MFALGVERDLLYASLAVRDEELASFQVTVSSTSSFVELRKNRSEQQTVLAAKRKVVLKTQLAEAEAHPDVDLTEMTEQRVHLREEVDRLSSDLGVLAVELKTICRQLSAARTKIATVKRQLIEQKRMKEGSNRKRRKCCMNVMASRRKLRSLRTVKVAYRKVSNAV